MKIDLSSWCKEILPKSITSCIFREENIEYSKDGVKIEFSSSSERFDYWLTWFNLNGRRRCCAAGTVEDLYNDLLYIIDKNGTEDVSGVVKIVEALSEGKCHV